MAKKNLKAKDAERRVELDILTGGVDQYSIEVYGHAMDYSGSKFKTLDSPACDLLEEIDVAHPSGGARVNTEPADDCLFMLDYEPLDDYDPTTLSIAQDFKAINDEHDLGLDHLVKQAREFARTNREDGVMVPWEDDFITALLQKGYLVYASDTRLEAYKFSQGVHDFIAALAASSKVKVQGA